MPDAPSSSTDAVVICTRNRPGELEQTLQSVAEQSGADNRLVLVVDGSDSDDADATARVVKSRSDDLPFRYHRHQGPPAQTRQRNAAVGLLPASVEILHFIDDDVTLQDEYFDALTEALQQHPSLVGVGGVIQEPGRSSPSSTWVHRLFLLNSPVPNRVLPSGHTTSPKGCIDQDVVPADWLSTCSSSYRRSVFDRHQFNPAVEGPSPTLHDLDFSYRVAQDGPLAIVPGAECVHRRAPRTRRDVRAAVRERVVRRYWFVEKNLDAPTHYAAFWWSMLGKFLILLASTTPDRNEGLRGFLRGLRAVRRRDHDLLHSE